MIYRSASSLSVVKSNQRARARSHTPKLPRSSVSLLLSVSSTSVTGSHSSVAKLRLPRMLLYVFHYTQRSPTFVSLTVVFFLERVRSALGQACQRGEEQACRAPKTPCIIDEEVEELGILVHGTNLWLIEELVGGVACFRSCGDDRLSPGICVYLARSTKSSVEEAE